jgi:AraC-like DNA-binding protein
VTADRPAYREWAPAPSLADHLACTWVGGSGPDRRDRIVPDGCVDIVWDGRELFVAGPDTGPVPLLPAPGGWYVGARFRPGFAPTLLGVPAATIVDRRVELADVWADRVDRLVDELAGAATPEDARAVLERALAGRLAEAASPDRLVVAAVDELRQPSVRVRGLARALEVSERQLLRRCTAAVGYGPKLLDRVLRLQRFLVLGERPGGATPGLAGLAAQAGYADQSHLSRDCLNLTGLTPSRLLRVSDSFKTANAARRTVRP